MNSTSSGVMSCFSGTVDLGRELVMGQGALQLFRGHVEPTRNQGEVRAQVAARFADQEAGDGGIVVHQQTAFAIKQLTRGARMGTLRLRFCSGRMR